ncbi:thiol:disulfide interchange protein DsbA/DsbL [Lysobacter tyrosinilyticus]
MMLRPALLLSVLLSLAACGGHNEPPAASTPAATAPAVATPAVATVGESAPTASQDAPVGPAPVAGIDYIEIAGGQPFAPADGRIEVAEVFSYTCPHCAHFEPMLEAWSARQPADVKLVPVAGPFGANPKPFAQAFYAAESLGLREKTHVALFNAIHVDGSLDAMQATPQSIAAFYGKFGVDPTKFAQAMDSADTNARMQHALSFIQKSGVDGSPGIIVAGKYRVTGKTMEDMLRITTHLVAKERVARGG